jgi:hypothetical protein
MQRPPGVRQQSLHLVAAMFSVQTPFAEVLAVIAQQTVAILPYAGSRAAGYFLTIEIR